MVAAILTSLFLSILVMRSTSGSSRRHYSKISLMSIGGQDIAVSAKIQNGSHRHLGFNFCLIFWHTCM